MRDIEAPPLTTIPLISPPAESTEAYGANVVLHGEIWDEANAEAMRIQEEMGLAFIHPFDDPLLWQGHASMIDEVARAGLRRRPDEGPLEYTERAALRWPQCSAVLRRIGETYALLRYGPESKERAGLVDALRAGVASLPAVRALRTRS